MPYFLFYLLHIRSLYPPSSEARSSDTLKMNFFLTGDEFPPERCLLGTVGVKPQCSFTVEVQLKTAEANCGVQMLTGPPAAARLCESLVMLSLVMMYLSNGH